MMSQKIIFLEGDNVFTSSKESKIFGKSAPLKSNKYLFAMHLDKKIEKKEVEKEVESSFDILKFPNALDGVCFGIEYITAERKCILQRNKVTSCHVPIHLR